MDQGVVSKTIRNSPLHWEKKRVNKIKRTDISFYIHIQEGHFSTRLRQKEKPPSSTPLVPDDKSE